MQVLVTGATGFIGRELVTALAQQGYKIRAAVRGTAAMNFPIPIEIVRHGDLAAQVSWLPLVAGCDAVVHLAGIAHAGPEISAESYECINRRATSELVRAAQTVDVARFIFVSSIRAQSGPAADHILTEADDERPTNAYGASKLAAERDIQGSALRYTILRPTLVYGAGVRGNLGALARLADSPWPLPFGALSNRRSLVNRASLIDAIAFSLRSNSAARQTFIVADREPIALNALLTALRRGFGRAPGLVSLPRATLKTALALTGRGEMFDRLDGKLIADPAKLIAAGWTPTEDTAAAVERLAKEMLTY